MVAIQVVNIEGLKKNEVLAGLYNASKTQGLNAQMERALGRPITNNITNEEAQEALNDGILYFDYFNGRVMKVDLSSDVEFDEWGYDRDNGVGAAQKVIDKLREK